MKKNKIKNINPKRCAEKERERVCVCVFVFKSIT